MQYKKEKKKQDILYSCFLSFQSKFLTPLVFYCASKKGRKITRITREASLFKRSVRSFFRKIDFSFQKRSPFGRFICSTRPPLHSILTRADSSEQSVYLSLAAIRATAAMGSIHQSCQLIQPMLHLCQLDFLAKCFLMFRPHLLQTAYSTIRALSAHSAAEFNISPGRRTAIWSVASVPTARWGEMDRNDCQHSMWELWDIHFFTTSQ
jgi:hypothetical protein